MGKLKTRKAVKKRFRLTKKGKVLRSKAFRRHIMTKKSSGRRRSLRGKALVSPADVKKLRKQLPYG